MILSAIRSIRLHTSALIVALSMTLASPLFAQSSKRPAITGIAFARFYTTDPTAAEHFYGSTLGFARKDGSGQSLYPVNNSQWIEIVSATPPQQNVRMAAVAFTTRDAAGLARYLTAHKIPIEQPLSSGRFAVRDPEGNLVLFVQSGSQKLVENAAPSPTATSKRIIHVGYLVHDAAREDAFWQQLLGFHPYWHGGQTDARTDYFALQVPDGTDWLEYMLNVGPTPSLQQMGVVDHFSLGIPDMSEVVTALARNHCEGPNCSKTQLGRDGKIQLNLFDPDLTRVEFMEFKPRKEPCCSLFTGKQPSLIEDK